MEKKIFYPHQKEQFEKEILKIIQSGEPGAIIFPPNTGKSNQLLEGLKYNFLTFDLALYGVDEVHELMDILKSQIKKKKKRKMAIIITNTQTLILNKNFRLIYDMIRLQEKDNRLRFVFLLNIDITHPDIAAHIKIGMFSYISYYPLYNREDSIAFIRVLMKQWHVNVEEVKIAAVADLCGGYFWLIKQAMICLKDQPDTKIKDLINYDGVRIALEQFYSNLFKSEQEVLDRLIFGHKVDTDILRHSLHHLQKVGVVRGEKVALPLLDSYIRTSVPKTRVETRNKHIFINDVNMDWHFSNKEKRAIRILIDKKHHLVTRDELAGSIWQQIDTESYSDWAVDRIIARLRTKLAELGLPRGIIETKRNRGYLFNA